ncbi:hypothetical protein HGRIS_014767 [Hohenbuehelia grisea]|uniref:Uncharacterized protein n=1 Tax=Hohenbuehelia grisea TaxID=104357 RepID=A0ABR3IQT8_9AGAR
MKNVIYLRVGLPLPHLSNSGLCNETTLLRELQSPWTVYKGRGYGLNPASLVRSTFPSSKVIVLLHLRNVFFFTSSHRRLFSTLSTITMKAAFFFLVLSALVAVNETSALPTTGMVARAKIITTKPKPPPATPNKPNPKPPADKPKPAPKPDPSTCNGIKDGNTCVTCGMCTPSQTRYHRILTLRLCGAPAKNTACGFNPKTNTCVDKKAGSGLITDSTKCQQNAASGSDSVKAQADALFNKMKSHIFNGEPGGKSDSGRHTFSSYRQANKDAGRCDTETHICAFRLKDRTPKTVWDDRNGQYSQSDVETMCKTAITLNIQDTGGKATRDGAFVVQTKFGKPICVRHQVAGSGSCFPVGIHSRTNKLGSTCSEGAQDTQAITGKNEEVA